jgi:hypothetical protein
VSVCQIQYDVENTLGEGDLVHHLLPPVANIPVSFVAYSPWFGHIFVTARQGSPYLRVIDMGQTDLVRPSIRA